MSLRALVFVALTALLAPAQAPAQIFDGRFFGGGTIFGFSDACVAAGWTNNALAYSVRYQPAGLGYNGSRSLLAFFVLNQAFAFQIEGPFTSRWQDVEHLLIMDGAFLNTPEHDHPTRLRIRNQNPRVIDETTTGPVRIRGQVQNFAATTGCQVNFELLLQQR